MKCNFNCFKKELDKIKLISKGKDFVKFQIKIAGNQCFLSYKGDNFAFETQCKIDNANNEKFEGIANFATFYEMVNKCKEEKFEIEIDGSCLIVKFANKTKSLCFDLDYKEIVKPEIDDNLFSKITISANKLKEIYENGICCVDKTKKYLDGFYLDKNEDGSYNVATTDEMRLSWQTYHFEGKEVVLNNKLINHCYFDREIFEKLQLLNEDLTIYYNENIFFIKTDKMYYSEKLKDTSFPRYRTVIQEAKTPYSYRFNCKDLANEIKDCVMKKGSFYRLSFSIRGNNCIIKYTFDNVINTNQFKCENIANKDMDFIVNYKLLLSILDVFDKKKYQNATFSLSDGQNPILIKTIEKNVNYLFMPFVS